MSAESNKALASRVLLEAFGQGKMAVLNEVITPDHVNTGPGALPGMRARHKCRIGLVS